MPKPSRPYKLTMEQVAPSRKPSTLAFYQFQLENVYTTSLAVTLQQFAFNLQFYAGLSADFTAGGSAPNPINPSSSRPKPGPRSA